MKLIYCIYFVVFCGIAAANQSDPPAVINAYSLSSVQSIFLKYISSTAPAYLAVASGVNKTNKMFGKLANVGVVYNWPLMPENYVPLYISIQKDNLIQANALENLPSSDSSSGFPLLLAPSDFNTILQSIKSNAANAGQVVTALNQYISVIKDLQDKADIDITTYNIDLPNSLANELTEAFKNISTANQQIANMLNSLGSKRGAYIASYQENSASKQFIKAMFSFSVNASLTISKIASLWQTGPKAFVADATINKKTQVFSLQIKILVNLIESISSKLGPLYGKIGADLYTFRNAFVRY